MLLAIMRAFSAFRSYRRQTQAMSELSNRELDDIGMPHNYRPRTRADSVWNELLFT